jgi:hypothetical protein
MIRSGGPLFVVLLSATEFERVIKHMCGGMSGTLELQELGGRVRQAIYIAVRHCFTKMTTVFACFQQKHWTKLRASIGQIDIRT